MNYLKTLNEIIRYLEENIKGSIDEKYMGKKYAISYDMISRIFSILIGMTPKKYLKYRRLSEAARDIASSNKKIVEIAMDYGYESVDAFSFAFKKYHSLSPSEVKNGGTYKYFQPLTFQISVRGGNDMDVRIEKREQFSLLAYPSSYTLEELNEDNLYYKVYEQFHQILAEMGIENRNLNLYGIYHQKEEKIIFSVACELMEKKLKKHPDLELMTIPASKYAVFTAKGSVRTSLEKAWEYIMGTFFGENDYKYASKPDFELYKAGNPFSDDYETEIYISIE